MASRCKAEFSVGWTVVPPESRKRLSGNVFYDADAQRVIVKLFCGLNLKSCERYMFRVLKDRLLGCERRSFGGWKLSFRSRNIYLSQNRHPFCTRQNPKFALLTVIFPFFDLQFSSLKKCKVFQLFVNILGFSLQLSSTDCRGCRFVSGWEFHFRISYSRLLIICSFCGKISRKINFFMQKIWFFEKEMLFLQVVSIFGEKWKNK